MSTNVLIVGASSPLARSTGDFLRSDYNVTMSGRSHGDTLIDLTGDIVIPKGTETLINFAAAFDSDTDASILSTTDTNAAGVLKLAMAAADSGLRHFVQISSMSAVHDSSSPYHSAYAITKRHGDELLEWYCGKRHLPLTILRPSQVYGNDPSFSRHQPFFYEIINRAKDGEDVIIFGNHDAKRNYLHADDFVGMIQSVIARKLEGTYPCLYPEDITYSEIAQAAQEVYGNGGTIRFQRDKPDIPDNVFPIDTAVYAQIEYTPRVTIRQGIVAIKTYQLGVNI